MRSESSNYHEKEISKQLRKTNYYEILDLKKNATQADIKKSFKQMALRYHPDKNSATYSKQVFHQVSEAYDTLSDPAKRNAYDQKQQFMKVPRQPNPFKEPTVFFHKSSSFYSDFDHEFRWSAFDYARRKAQEERMDERARHEREKFRNEQSQRNKAHKGQQGQFYRRQGQRNKKGDQQQESQKKQKQEQQNEAGRERKNFEFTKPRMASEKQTEYEQRRREKQRKARLQKQRDKANKNMSMFMLFLLIVVFWIYLDYNKVQFRGPPVYSITQSSIHNISKFTQKLHSPFFVTKDYIERADADDRFRQHIERKMDFAYIKLLSRVCNNNKRKEQELNDNLALVKSTKSKNSLLQQLQLLDLSSCSKLHSLRQLNPLYFQRLFSANSPKEQL